MCVLYSCLMCTYLWLYPGALACHPQSPSYHRLSWRKWCLRRTDTFSSLWLGYYNSPDTWGAQQQSNQSDLLNIIIIEYTHTNKPIPDDTVKAADLLIWADCLIFAGEILHGGCSTISDMQRRRRVLQTDRWSPLSWCWCWKKGMRKCWKHLKIRRWTYIYNTFHLFKFNFYFTFYHIWLPQKWVSLSSIFKWSKATKSSDHISWGNCK